MEDIEHSKRKEGKAFFENHRKYIFENYTENNTYVWFHADPFSHDKNVLEKRKPWNIGLGGQIGFHKPLWIS